MRNFKNFLLLCLTMLGISVNANAIDMKSTMDCNANPCDMVIGTSANDQYNDATPVNARKRAAETYASVDELIAADLDNAVVNVEIDAAIASIQAYPNYFNPEIILYFVLLDNGVTLYAPGQKLDWAVGGTVTGTLTNVIWDGVERMLSSEDLNFWSSLTYSAGKSTETISIADACTDGTKYYSTYSSLNAFYVPAELTVCEVKVEDDKLTMVPYKTGDLVAPFTGLLISASKSGEYEVEIADMNKLDDIVTLLEDENALRPSCYPGGLSADVMADMDPDTEFFRLTMHNGTACGFWWGAEDGAAFDIAPNKAYLAVNPESNIKGFLLNDTTTGIAALNAKAEKDAAFNLNGQRVDASFKGIVISNGRKSLRK